MVLLSVSGRLGASQRHQGDKEIDSTCSIAAGELLRECHCSGTTRVKHKQTSRPTSFSLSKMTSSNVYVPQIAYPSPEMKRLDNEGAE